MNLTTKSFHFSKIFNHLVFIFVVFVITYRGDIVQTVSFFLKSKIYDKTLLRKVLFVSRSIFHGMLELTYDLCVTCSVPVFPFIPTIQYSAVTLEDTRKHIPHNKRIDWVLYEIRSRLKWVK